MQRILSILILLSSYRALSQTGTARYEEASQIRMGDSSASIYIPATIYESFLELDKQISSTQKEAIKGLQSKKEVYEGQRDLAIWIRDKWGLWKGSRLQQYFRNKKVNHPDKMYALILNFYHDWLKGNNTGWQQWENAPNKYVL